MASRVQEYGDEVCYEYCSCVNCRLRLIEKELVMLRNGLSSKHRESPV